MVVGVLKIVIPKFVGSEESRFFVYATTLRGLVTLSVGIAIISMLQAGIVTAWIPLFMCWGYSAGERFIGRYLKNRLTTEKAST